MDGTGTIGTGSKVSDVKLNPAEERFCRNVKYIGIVMFSILSVFFAIVLINATRKLIDYIW